MKLPQTIENVVTYLSRLPGVGEKSALRHTLFLSKFPKEELLQFAASLKELSELGKCEECGFFSEEEKCSICNNEMRGETKVLCIVEGVTDLLAIEKSSQFKGRYHVLGGVLNPLLGIGPNELGINKLIDRIKRDEVEELVLAINPSVEGDATCSFIKELLPDGVKAERIGFGMPMGGSLEYLDTLTISKALENRTSF